MNKEIENLKQQLSELESNHDLLIDTFQAERENLCKEIKKHSEARQRAIEKIKELEKEIDELKFIQRNAGGLIEKFSEKGVKQLRHEICEKIKIAMTSIEPNCSIEDMNSNLYEFTGREIYAILDQIERGEE